MCSFDYIFIIVTKMTELYNPESLKVPCDKDDYDYNLTCTDLFLRTKVVYDGDFS